MNMIICDICGSTYSESETHCPICGSAKPVEAEAVDATAENAGYTYVKGGRFSKSNVRKRNRGAAVVTTSAAKEKAAPKEKSEGSVRGLIITAAVLLLAILVVIGFVAVKYFFPPESDGPQHLKDTIACTEIAIEKTNYELTDNNATVQLEIDLKPTNTTDKVRYSSSNDEIASVDESGLVTGNKPGEVTITISCGTQVIEVKVKSRVGEPKEVLKLTRVSLELTSLDDSYILYSDDLGTIKVKDVTWTTDDASIAEIEDGVVYAVGEGVTSVHGEYNGTKVSCIVTVTIKNEDSSGGVGEDGGNTGIGEDGGNTGVGEDGDNTATSAITINTLWGTTLEDFTIKSGEELTLVIKDANGKTVSATITVSDETICSINGNVITGLSTGSGKVGKLTATYNGVSVSCIIRGA